VTLALVLASYIKLYQTVDSLAPGIALVTFGLVNLDTVAFLLFLSTTLSIACFVAALVYNDNLEPRIAEIKERETQQPPDLQLKVGQIFHLFNSHIWSTGQDAVAGIKRQLQRLLPAIRVFLDVDDLENIGDLEKYVDQSAVILIFLSKGYFKSKNCLREVVATIEQKKPYLFVQEADPAKGGGTLDMLKLELADEAHREALFDGRRVTVWFRIQDFQVVSLIQIAEDMMRQLPAKPLKGSLYVPGSLLEQPLKFKTPVVLYASPNNPGALEAAQELHNAFPKGISFVQSSGLAGATGAASAAVKQTVVTVDPAQPAPGAPPGDIEVQAVTVSKVSAASTGAGGARPTHFLLYLNLKTFTGAEGAVFADEVRKARESGMEVAMIHENAEEKDGCEFGTFFGTTPQDLIDDGLYRALAISFVSGASHRKVSYSILAKTLGAKVASRKDALHVSNLAAFKPEIGISPKKKAPAADVTETSSV